MAKDAVWIIVTIPKKEYEKILNEKNYHKKSRHEGMLQIKSFPDEEPMEKQLESILQSLGIESPTWVPDKTGNRYHIYFSADLYENDYIINRLREIGIGVRKETSLGYLPFGLFWSTDDDLNDPDLNNLTIYGLNKEENRLKKAQKDFLKSVTSRLTVAQVVEGVRSGASLTFDFVAYTTFAGFIAAAGLLNNSPVDIAAAMMIEPIMATVMAICFGSIIHDRGLAKLGAINLIIVLLICIVIGFFYGLVFMTWSTAWDPPPEGVWPTPEMEVRGTWRALIYGLLQAMGAGGAVAITLLNDAQCPLVGVAVASTFLPPHINTGLLWAYACHLQWRGMAQDFITYNSTSTGQLVTLKPAWRPQEKYTVHYYEDMRYETIALGGVSLLLTYVNVVGMIFVAYIMLWLKQVVPMGKMDSNKRFFKEDIGVARYYNRKSMAVTTDDVMGKRILEEWANIAGLDPNQLLSTKPEARVTQLQTLKDLISDVENDDVYQSVTKGAIGRPDQGPNLLRRLTQATIHGSRRSSISQGATNPAFKGDSELGLPVKSKRGYTINPSRRSSRLESENNNETIHSESSFGRGLRPVEMEPHGRRKSSVALRRQLQETDHSPFSIWPANSPRPMGRFEVAEVRRRMSSLRLPTISDPLEVHRESIAATQLINIIP
ncbi:uncharacterized protein LOC107360786 [Tetranychus urticae]|uniref:DUF389 domain-containing protein n=1 Tax=Tetranychus urticae TaxID=32264 RepID=T1K3V1_TETUR|nr:uncharacterized protein LOC107360786 [Tetranychus urticae]